MDEAKPSAGPREDPGLTRYLQTIEQHRQLTNAEEAELLGRIRRGAREPLDQLVNSNLRSVVCIARDYLDRGLGFLDLIAEGTLALISAARRFDQDRDSAFSPYARDRIRQAIHKAVREAT